MHPYQTILDAIPLSAALIDQSGVIRMVNRAWRAYAAANGQPDPDACLGWNYLTVCDQVEGEDAEIAQAVSAGIRALLTGQESAFELEYPNHLPSQDRWGYLRASPFEFEGEPAALLLHEDITEKRRAREMLYNTRRELETLLNASHNDAILLMDPTGIVLEVNGTCARVMGYPRDAIVGHSVWNFFAPDVVAKRKALFEQVLERDRPLTFEDREAGRIFESTLYPIRGQGGVHVAVALFAHDITNRMEDRERIRRADQMAAVGTMVSGVAHQFNNLTVPILGYADILVRAENLSDKQRGYLAVIQRASERVKALTESMLSYVRTEPGDPLPVDLNTVLNTMDLMLRTRAQAEGADFELHLGPEAKVLGFAQEVEKVILALFENALDAVHGRDHRAIQIESAVEAGEAMIAVHDTGCGIAPEDRPQIFNPFFTKKGEFAPQRTAQQARRGVGLGLSIAHTLTEHMGGHITVDSESEVGSTFRVWLPLHGAAAGAQPGLPGPAEADASTRPTPSMPSMLDGMDGEALAPGAEERPALPPAFFGGSGWRRVTGRLGGRIVLVLDDDESVRTTTVDLLKALGLDARATGEAAIAAGYLNRGEVALLLLDCTMPGLDTPRWLKTLMKRNPERMPPVVIVTGRDLAEVRAHFAETPVHRFLPKPFSIDELNGIVEALADQLPV